MRNKKVDPDPSDRKGGSYADEWPDGYSIFGMKNLNGGTERSFSLNEEKKEKEKEKEGKDIESKDTVSYEKATLSAMREFSADKLKLLYNFLKNTAAM